MKLPPRKKPRLVVERLEDRVNPGAGQVQTVAGNNGTQDQMVLIRLNTDGTLDNTFDGDGKKIVTVDNGSGPAAIAFQPDGKLVLAGTAWPTTNDQPYFIAL